VTLDPDSRSRLVGIFIDEAQDTLASLDSLADRLRDATGPEALADFGRCAHGLKGAASSLGYEDLGRILHALEALSLELDDAAPQRRSERYERLRKALELLGNGVAEMSASARDGFPPGVSSSLCELLGVVAPATAAPQAPGSGGSGDAIVERLSVPATDVDEALRIAASLARAAAALEARLATGADASAAQVVTAEAQQLEASIAALRLMPAGSALAGVATEVGHLASRLGKEVRLEVAGRDVRADRRTLQTARGLLRHLIRNAIDHGIEPPEERARTGKPPGGRLALSVETAESALRVALSDDGAGFDLAAVRRELARRTGDQERVAALSDSDVLNEFAAEGGSTREQVSDVSGRGLGLSAVAASARAAGGFLEVRTGRGSGSTVTFTLPLDVYAIEVLVMAAGRRRLGIPLSAVERTICFAAAPEAVQSGPAGRVLAVGEAIVPLVNLSAVLGYAPGAERFGVVIRTAKGALALGIEDVVNVASVVPKRVTGLAQPDALVSGVARLGDGSALQILNPPLLAAVARTSSVHAAAGSSDGAAPTQERPGNDARTLDVVLAEDSLATREVLRVLLEQQGFRVRLAADGIEALARIRERLPDVLVTDVNMPRCDGLALTRELRAGDGTARLPVILLTSQDDDATRAAGAAAGADAYLLKSRFDAALLDQTLSRLGVRKTK
jgi:two-component system chemotaxis sensor kinase CheA